MYRTHARIRITTSLAYSGLTPTLTLATLRQAARAADQIWPIAGDPTFPESRRASDAWVTAFEAFIGEAVITFRHPEERILDNANGGLELLEERGSVESLAQASATVWALDTLLELAARAIFTPAAREGLAQGRQMLRRVQVDPTYAQMSAERDGR